MTSHRPQPRPVRVSAQAKSKTAPPGALPRKLAARIAPAVVGDRIPAFDDQRAGYVKTRCSADPYGAFICITCRAYLANVCQLDLHTEQQGHHSVARICLAHGVETL